MPATSRCAVVTGAAGALGQAVVERFRQDGLRLALIDRDEGRLRQVFPSLTNEGHLLVAGDVTDAADMRRVARTILEEVAQVGIVVHVAGGFEMGEATHELSRAVWERMMNLNAWSFVAVTGAFVPSMLAQGCGRIVAVSARAAAQGQANMGAYIAAKSALQRLVESLSRELRDRGISVNSIAPSIMDTAANRAAMPKSDPAKWVSTAQAAAAIAYLASDEAEPVHGQHLVIDGRS
jgi:NAD(P)-dependent dehydrogenase (short-subunit alcohol dehydrogenase family)